MDNNKWTKSEIGLVLIIAFLLSLIIINLFTNISASRPEYESTLVNDLTDNITAYCYGDKECQVYTVQYFILNRSMEEWKNDTFVDALIGNNNPENTLKNGNDCEGWVTLGRTMFNHLNITTYWVTQQAKFYQIHACLMVKIEPDRYTDILCYDDYIGEPLKIMNMRE
jgi:hypothetical protein